MSDQFDFVSVKKKPTIHYGGRSVSHLLQMQDGSKKTIGVFLPSEQALIFKTHVNERVEITSGQCLVQIGAETEYVLYAAGQSFVVPMNSQFKILVKEVVDYICHFD
ncbi:MAG: pyrimidine/purine nucleoside phosphorylase [Acinetobacter sp.]